MAKRYNITDGKLLLTLEPDPTGGFTVTSPIDPAMITEAETIPEAFAMARDAFAALTAARADPHRWDNPKPKAKTRVRRQRPAGVGA